MAAIPEQDKPAEMKAWDPTIRQRLASGAQSLLEKAGVDRYTARKTAQSVMGGESSNLPQNVGLADFVPFLGTGLQLEDSYEGGKKAVADVKRGDYVGAGVESLFAGLGLLPGIGPTIKATRAAHKKLKEFKAPNVPMIKESRYDTKQEGPFYRVKPRSVKASGQSDHGVREKVRKADDAAGSGRGDVPQSVTDKEVAALIKDPSSFVRRAADSYSHVMSGKGYSQPQMPGSSLAKQSAIGRSFQLAVEDSPQYKQAVFNAYAKSNPEVVERSGAKNYDQLLESAYRQLAKETTDQFHTLPVNMSYHRGGEGAYKSSQEMLRDVYGNKHLYVYQGGDPHTFLNAVDPETGLNTNEMFRAVHDFYGHGVHGNQFGAKGEEIAYGAHSQMFSPLARMAMAAETRGQNSFVNYTPLNAELRSRINSLNAARYEAGRRGEKADVAEIDKVLGEAWGTFQYAPQKALLLPPEFVDTGYTGGMPGYVQSLVTPEPGTAVRETLTHYSHSPDLQVLDPGRYGSGIAGREMERLRGTENPVMDRSYFYTGDPASVRPEAGLGRHRYGAESDAMYDLSADPLGLNTLAREANRAPWTGNVNPGVARPQQAATDFERMIREHGYEGMVNPSQGMGMTFNPTPVQPFAGGGAVGGLGHYAGGGLAHGGSHG